MLRDLPIVWPPADLLTFVVNTVVLVCVGIASLIFTGKVLGWRTVGFAFLFSFLWGSQGGFSFRSIVIYGWAMLAVIAMFWFFVPTVYFIFVKDEVWLQPIHRHMAASLRQLGTWFNQALQQLDRLINDPSHIDAPRVVSVPRTRR